MSHQSPQNPDFSDRWIQAIRRNNKITPSWACSLCSDRKIFTSSQSLWAHAQSEHIQSFPSEKDELEKFRTEYENESAQKVTKYTMKGDSQRPPILNEANKAQPEPPPSKRPISTPSRLAATRSISGLRQLNLGTAGETTDVDMDDEAADGQPKKRQAVGDGISAAGSASPFRGSSASPPPPEVRRSKGKPNTNAAEGNSREMLFDSQRPAGGNGKHLWSEQDSRAPLSRASVDPSNIASVSASKARKALSKPTPQKTGQSSRIPITPSPSNNGNKSASSQNLPGEGNYDIILQPETRPISQEQLVAEVKGIYAGLVMVEAKCIEVDNKQAVLAQADTAGQNKLNNEQWQALIALHRTLLHEHHDFFLASQHPSASPALRRLASKYAMPARMWRHGIHSFLELLRHRLPASLDHMLAFIYLAYSMMALLYETVPAFEDTWIECLGDLGRYRMAIEDDDIRDREVWTGVARHWYSKASDKAPTTGRLYHHLAILARPNALQQLFYYSKSLCVATPFVSARDSILTLFNPVLEADPSHGQLRLPPLDLAFVKAHGLLFTYKHIEKFEETKTEFLGLLDNQIGRVTRKFMEQGYHIAIANCVAMTSFAAKDNVLMQIISPSKDGTDTAMVGNTSDQSMHTFKLAQALSNATLIIVLRRIGDPNVLPFLHCMLVFIFNMVNHASAMELLAQDFPWDLLAVMLNTLLAQYKTLSRIEADQFPKPALDDYRPFPEDFALRGLLTSEGYYPAGWFTHEKIDEEEKHHERASMTDERKERILWLACRIAKAGPWLSYDGHSFKAGKDIFSTGEAEPVTLSNA